MADRVRLADVVSRLLPTGAALRAHIAGQMASAWKALGHAMGVSDATAAQYENAIAPVDAPTARVELTGTFPNMFEQGMGPNGVGSEGPFDIRTFALRDGTRNLRHGPKGMYLNVPFGHTLASIAGRGGDAAVKAAKALSPTLSVPSGAGGFRTLWGGRLPAGLAPKIAEHHATDPLHGLVRKQAAYAAATQSTFQTWRRLTEWGKPWIHPGIRARNNAAKVAAQGADFVVEALRALGRP